jgi:hypothetical protein
MVVLPQAPDINIDTMHKAARNTNILLFIKPPSGPVSKTAADRTVGHNRHLKNTDFMLSAQVPRPPGGGEKVRGKKMSNWTVTK